MGWSLVLVSIVFSYDERERGEKDDTPQAVSSNSHRKHTSVSNWVGGICMIKNKQTLVKISHPLQELNSLPNH